jgi:hypothetical protein
LCRERQNFEIWCRLWKLEAAANVEEDVVGFWLDKLVAPEAVVLFDPSKESIPLCLIISSVGQWWGQVEAVNSLHGPAEMCL